ncbi:nuclear transport factor 2 family protein [Ornithinimicrobium murale]|uniref:nuclear transport factor 2 family protein n=1 Tax=Ornithinimicrobium murale TaxID=1050153 RepID=UPI000E0D5019|nr:nuclear transport factor 2 family protein [Ornithinimicrobium murale]
MSADTPHKQVVKRYLEGFRTGSPDQILSCLTDDIVWTVYGHFRLSGKEAYRAAIGGEGGLPTLDVVRLVEEGDTVMAEIHGVAPQPDGTRQRMVMGEVFLFRGDLICERRAFLVPLQHDDIR